MKSSGKTLSRAVPLSLAAIPMAATVARADQPDFLPFAFGAGFLLFFGLTFLATYIYFSLAMQAIAAKTGTPNGWLAWVPIANMYLLVAIAKKPVLWFILTLIPLVNVVMLVLIWMAVAEIRGKPNWWGILIIVPVACLIVPGYLAWAD